MEMTLRWYGSKFDTVTLKQIRQIPGVTGVITTLYDTEPGEVWSRGRIRAMKDEVEAAGLHVAGIESVNIHDAIKTGAPEREQYIANYIETLENLGKEDIHMVCYNFMPVFDWTRTELARVRADGSTVLAYTQEAVDALDPEKMFESISGDMNGSIMPGWEPERMARVKELFEMYKDVDDEKLFENLKYFLEKVIPVAAECDVNMAIHEDDPCWSIFGLPRIITCEENLDRFLKLVDDKHNGITLCAGSLGCSNKNDVAKMAAKYAKMGRIHFVHMRNVKVLDNGFEESAHLSSCGSLDMYEIMKVLGKDRVISRLNNEYRNTLSNYEKILKSRNDELKKDNIDINLIKALTYQLIDYSYVIYNYRKKYIDKLNELISLTYEKINNKTKDIKIIYKPFIDNLENYKKEALKLYNLSYKEDLNKKITTKGVHKEDFNIEVDNKDISKFGSQGENRMVILALKLSTYYLKNDNDSKPVVILDDVLSELDKNHEQLLIKYLNEFEQVFITGTGNINLSNTYEVKDNQVILSED